MSVIDVIGRTLEPFDDDRLIPAFGFGDSTTGDKACFPFLPHGESAVGVEAVLEQYKRIAAAVTLSGPTSFAAVIHEAINIVRQEESYHILVIIADGQVTDASPTGATAQAIIAASQYPLSIIVVGVGDGPWHAMEHYDDELPQRKFDNFQFVEWNAVQRAHRRNKGQAVLDARFALAALMEIPDQYAFIKQAGLLNPSTWPSATCHRSTVPAPLPAPEFQDAHQEPLPPIKPRQPAAPSNGTVMLPPPAYTPSIHIL